MRLVFRVIHCGTLYGFSLGKPCSWVSSDVGSRSDAFLGRITRSIRVDPYMFSLAWSSRLTYAIRRWLT